MMSLLPALMTWLAGKYSMLLERASLSAAYLPSQLTMMSLLPAPFALYLSITACGNLVLSSASSLNLASSLKGSSSLGSHPQILLNFIKMQGAGGVIVGVFFPSEVATKP